MATTTPNYGWPVPTNTDYVKDGANAISDLGDAIDATVFALPSGGLTLISTATYSAVAGVTIDNCFSATYTNYKILSKVSLSGNNYITLNYRTAGGSPSTDTNNNYSNNVFGTQNNAAWASSNYNTARSNSILAITGGSFTSDLAFEIEVFSPNAAARTTGNHKFRVYNSSTANMGFYVGGHGNSSTTQFGGIYFATDVGTITGNIAVYGYAI